MLELHNLATVVSSV